MTSTKNWWTFCSTRSLGAARALASASSASDVATNWSSWVWISLRVVSPGSVEELDQLAAHGVGLLEDVGDRRSCSAGSRPPRRCSMALRDDHDDDHDHDDDGGQSDEEPEQAALGRIFFCRRLRSLRC